MYKKYLVFILLFTINICAFAQPTVLYSSINTTPRVALSNIGLFLQGRMQANQAGYQRWAFHSGTVASPDYSQNWRIGSTPNALSFSNFLQAGYSNGANYFTGGAGTDGELNPAIIGNYYTFNVTKNAFASNDMEVIETNFNPTVISTVTQSPLSAAVVANTSVAVTITMASAPALGENVFLRYSIDGYANSSLIQATFTGNTSVVNIPCQAAGTTLSYYVFSSTETLAGINSDLAAFGVNSYDMATLNLNNNGGPNYSYTVAAAPTNIIAYAGTPYCSNAGTAMVTNTGTLGGVYSSTAGLSINATTGAINLAASTAGTYMVTYTIAAAGSCALFTATTMVTITAAPNATIAYAGSPYCSNVSTATVTRVGTNGGTYSSTAGLNINATTGDINIATSTAGTYTVTYTVAAAGGCALFTTTTSITITTAPNATISYGTLPYCSNSGTANVIRTGTTGGTYTSTAGLVINASTGAVTLATSTAGTYTVTYTLAAAGGCAAFTTTANISITAAPNATINYAGSPYCSNVATASVTRVGTSGGTYSSTAGLNINATTGDINIATSTAGTYTVIYTVAAAGGCALFTTTTSITITTAPNATISYGSLPFCSNSGTANVTQTGTTGGIYTSTAGLVINASTGSVTLATSTAGTYTVTYTVAAAGGCAAFTTTASISITAAPNATITYAGSPYCPGTTTATVTRTGTAGGVYTSTTGLALNATTGDVNIATSTAGTYVVTYTIAAVGGCAAFTTTTNIAINTLSTAPTSATASSTLICANNGTVNLTATGGTLGTGAAYKWYSGTCGGTLVGTDATLNNVAINTTTTFFVRIEGTCNNTTCQSVTVTVAPKPVVEITIAPPGGVTPAAPVTIIATVSPPDNYTYTWTKNNTINLNINRDRIVVTANEAGDYNVKVTAPSGCTSTSVNAFVNSANSTTLFIFPNPNNGLFNVSYNNGAANLNGRSINIYDSKAARVYTQTYNNVVPFSNMKVDMRGYASGTYYLVLRDVNGKELGTGKVLVF
jgi:Ig-like domain CHU_C associated/Secretion system C-terminal sorting domain